ncbi:MAG: DUF4380 domain-containing protein [Lewinella sp.]
MIYRHLQAMVLACLFLACTATENTDSIAPVTISRGAISLTVEPAIGGRLSSLTFGGVEVLKTSRDSSNFQWGSTTWSSPQADWNWPPVAAFDAAPFKVMRVDEKSILLEGPKDSLTHLRMRKRFTLGPDNDIGLIYWLTNEGVSSVNVALWENTRLPYAGRFEFRADSIRGSLDTLPVTLRDSVYSIYADARHSQPQKVFADMPTTTARYYHKGMVLIKHNLANAFYRVAPGQAPLEIYLDPPAGFVEFELQGDYRLIEPGESNNLRSKWSLEWE